jgi:hypothetical protein
MRWSTSLAISLPCFGIVAGLAAMPDVPKTPVPTPVTSAAATVLVPSAPIKLKKPVAKAAFKGNAKFTDALFACSNLSDVDTWIALNNAKEFDARDELDCKRVPAETRAVYIEELADYYAKIMLPDENGKLAKMWTVSHYIERD